MRVSRGEVISVAELESRYLPLPANYDSVVTWLTDSGFSIVTTDPSRLTVEASGSVAQIAGALQVTMAGVTVNGQDYAAATDEPQIPAQFAGVVMGINGLQPFRHRHKHVRYPQVAMASQGFVPSQILKAYNAAGAAYNGTALTGNGQTIGIIIDKPPLTSDLSLFWANAGVTRASGATYSVVDVNSTGTFAAPDGEESLDTEWTSSIAPGANIVVYAAGSLNDAPLDNALATALSDAMASGSTLHQISISLGIGENYTTQSQVNTDSGYMTALASQGVSVFVSSGDGGSTPNDQKNPPDATGSLNVESYADDPFVTGVGGTSLTLTSGGARSAESAWSGSGGGTSKFFARPSWQVGTGVVSGSFRLVPDVCLPADPHTGAYLVLNGTSGGPIGGTSWSAPAWAGFSALLNQARTLAGKSPMGLLNASVYPLNLTSVFFDITSGSNSIGSKSGGNYVTTPGYDEVTGLGSPNIGNLIATLTGSSGVSVTGFSPSSAAAGASVVIAGSGFTGANTVVFNGVKASAISVTSDTSITATVPAGATTGVVAISSSTATGVSTATFTVSSGGASGDAVLISQVYGGGGGTGAPYNSDFIELYNPGSAAVSLKGYSVQYASKTSTAPWAVTALATASTNPVIAAHGYFLVAEIVTSGTGRALPTPDRSGSIDLSATGGKVALVSNTSPLGGMNDVNAAGVVDFVGYGGANEYKTAAAAAPSTATAVLRAGAGSVDTGNNSADFAVGAPNPRNSATPPSYPDLTIAMTHSASFKQTDVDDSYSITLANSGPAITSGAVSVVETPPSGLTVTAMSGAGWMVDMSMLTAARSDALTPGASYPVLSVTVSVGETAATNVTNIATASGGGEMNTSNDTASDVTTITQLTASEKWRYDNFGSTANMGAGADSAVSSSDGLTNLLKYALGLNPNTPAIVPETISSSSGNLQLSVSRNPNATDVTFSIESTGDLTNAASWSTSNVGIDQDTPTLLQGHDKALIGDGVPRYIRLRVTR